MYVHIIYIYIYLNMLKNIIYIYIFIFIFIYLFIFIFIYIYIHIHNCLYLCPSGAQMRCKAQDLLEELAADALRHLGHRKCRCCHQHRPQSLDRRWGLDGTGSPVLLNRDGTGWDWLRSSRNVSCLPCVPGSMWPSNCSKPSALTWSWDIVRHDMAWAHANFAKLK